MIVMDVRVLGSANQFERYLDIGPGQSYGSHGLNINVKVEILFGYLLLIVNICLEMGLIT